MYNTKYGPTNCYISAGYINVDRLSGILKREATSRYAAKFVVARGKPVQLTQPRGNGIVVCHESMKLSLDQVHFLEA